MMFLLMVTLSSTLLAAIMSMIAWRMAAQERRRSDARVAALAAEIHTPAAAAWHDDLPLGPAAPVAAPAHLFANVQAARRRSRVVPAAIVVALVTAGATVAFVMPDRDAVGARTVSGTVKASTGYADAIPAPDTPAGSGAASAPLELIALGHERDGDRLVVRGVVRNPSGAVAPDRLAVVVSVFHPDGALAASGRAAIDAGALRPDGTFPFVVTIPGIGAVSRYRVSFRTDDRVVPHVDRRTGTP